MKFGNFIFDLLRCISGLLLSLGIRNVDILQHTPVNQRRIYLLPVYSLSLWLIEAYCLFRAVCLVRTLSGLFSMAVILANSPCPKSRSKIESRILQSQMCKTLSRNLWLALKRLAMVCSVFGGCFSEVLLRYERLPFASQLGWLGLLRHDARHWSNTLASEFTQARVTSCGLASPSGAARQ